MITFDGSNRDLRRLTDILTGNAPIWLTSRIHHNLGILIEMSSS